MPKFITVSLFRNACKVISSCIEHLHDEDLSAPEIKARELLVEYCVLLVERWTNPDYGKDDSQVQP